MKNSFFDERKIFNLAIDDLTKVWSSYIQFDWFQRRTIDFFISHKYVLPSSLNMTLIVVCFSLGDINLKWNIQYLILWPIETIIRIQSFHLSGILLSIDQILVRYLMTINRNNTLRVRSYKSVSLLCMWVYHQFFLSYIYAK